MAIWKWIVRAWSAFGHGTRAAALYQLLLGWPQWAAAVVTFLVTAGFGVLLPWAFVTAAAVYFFAGIGRLAHAAAKAKSAPPAQQAAKAAATRAEFHNEMVRIADLVTGSPLIADRRFTLCVIRGPAFLKPHSQCHFRFVASARPPVENISVAPEGAPIHGAILLTNVTFQDCYFDGAALIGTQEDARQLTPAFHTETQEAWARRLGFTNQGVEH